MVLQEAPRDLQRGPGRSQAVAKALGQSWTIMISLKILGTVFPRLEIMFQEDYSRILARGQFSGMCKLIFAHKKIWKTRFLLQIMNFQLILNFHNISLLINLHMINLCKYKNHFLIFFVIINLFPLQMIP